MSETQEPRVLVERGGAVLRIGLDRPRDAADRPLLRRVGSARVGLPHAAGEHVTDVGLPAGRDRRDPVRTGR